ncbi:hypothetical protein JAAARDRAFT_600587 [Jaapia argillacea MUCL 33604]|uniref:Uncharacterized protein n=1 Tax=Jaapia argillacea MUCL 33604 TaxID=933084 RepID=A0A067QCE1_9AGAM|nr:hypothetical protein JAAARDRAFT_600587 [Jaapia argillacea MUCL 33604]
MFPHRTSNPSQILSYSGSLCHRRHFRNICSRMHRRQSQQPPVNPRPSSSSTSSLSGAMGATHISSHPGQASWNQRVSSQSQIGQGFDGLSGPIHGAPPSMPSPEMFVAPNTEEQYSAYGYAQPSYPNMQMPSDPAALLSSYSGQVYDPVQRSRSTAPGHSYSMSGNAYTSSHSAHSAQVPPDFAPSSSRSSQPSREQLVAEIRHLRNRVRELESANSATAHSSPSSSTGAESAPSSPSFEASLRARTDTRIRMFCSLNRAGNALCSWHDSRRERRLYPPRGAPPGYMNCGCTYEEALFEESLARHEVGGYLPGDSVRMDPALRNPLLRLLQQRYGYRDGDFERDPTTGGWVEGEGHQVWEAKARNAAASSARKVKSDERR